MGGIDMKHRTGRFIRTGIASALFLALSVIPALGASAAHARASAEGISVEKLIERHAKKDAKISKIYECRTVEYSDRCASHQKSGTKHRPI